MEKDILQMTPIRLLDFWEVEGKPPFYSIKVRGLSGIYELDQISSFVWLRLEGSVTVDSIVIQICNNFAKVEREQVERDIIVLLKRLDKDDLIILDYNPLNPYKELRTLERIEKVERKMVRANFKDKKQQNEIFLIVPPSPLVYPRMFIQYLTGQNPLGIGYIAALLQKEGYHVSCLNLYLGLKNLEYLKNLITQSQPLLVGISTMTENYQNGLRLANAVKSIHPKSTVIFGGPHVTFLDEEVLLENNCVDIVVRREGEFTMLELANYFIRGKGSLNDIRGITYKHNGSKIVRTAGRSLLKDIDALPFPIRDIPDLDGILLPKEVRQIIITSRGCPGRCKFCAASALSGGKYRMRSVNNIVNELIDLKRKNKIETISFGDDTITADLSRLFTLCDAMKNIGIKWSGESRVDAMTNDLAITLANSGCVGLQFGVESGSQYLLDEMGKNITISQIEQAVKWSVDAGLFVICSMMIGVPGDTLITIEQTINFAEKLQKIYKVGVILGCTVPYPGTYYYNQARNLGISISTKNYDLYSTINPIMDTQQLTRWEVRNLYSDAIPRLYQSLPPKYKELIYRVSKDTLKKDGYRVPSFKKDITK